MFSGAEKFSSGSGGSFYDVVEIQDGAHRGECESWPCFVANGPGGRGRNEFYGCASLQTGLRGCSLWLCEGAGDAKQANGGDLPSAHGAGFEAGRANRFAIGG